MKLEALTLAGFKSFPDKTTFDFHDGVTCVVGPNGCGKSNLVDAFKWVLGEQSAKSLRGGGMADVIFSGTAQRRSAGFAEVILTFAGASSLAAASAGDAPDAGENHTVTVARRLYRSGESEYLLNKKIVRLKDIREMFMDTGVGGYSLIEQGRVEAFLQASSVDRRAVFDEAAGISRYKARKAEAVRRLERVEQNLLRLTDILSEVRKRLRSIKYQASKARNYQKYSERLAELRSLFSLAQYHRLSGRRRDLQQQSDNLTDSLANLTAHIGRLEASETTTETEMADLQRKAHDLEGRISELAAQIAASRQRAEMLSARAAELSDALATDMSRCEQLEAKVVDGRQEADAARERLDAVTAELAELVRRDASAGSACADGRETVGKLRSQLEDEKNGTIELLRRTAQLHNEINTYNLHRENLHARRQRLAGRTEEIAKSLEDILARRSAGQVKLDEVETVLADSQSRLDRTQQNIQTMTDDEERLQTELSGARQDRSGLLSRRNVLEEMQRRREGVGEGVRRVLAAVAEGKAPFDKAQGRPFVLGMLSDFVETDVAHAGVIEAALAGAQQWLVADGGRYVAESARQIRQVAGDAGGIEFVCLDRMSLPTEREVPAPPDGIIALATDWIRCDDDRVRPLLSRLLGRTLVVRTLWHAFDLAGRLETGWRFVTTDGEVLESDGRVRLASGPVEEKDGQGLRVEKSRTTHGPIWRKSELAELDRKLRENQARIDELTRRVDKVHSERKHLDEVVHSLRTAVYEANTERVACRGLLEHLDEQVGELQTEAPLVAQEVRRLADEIASAAAKERQSKDGAAELEADRSRRESEVVRLNEALAAAVRRQDALSAEVTAAQVALASAEQKRSAEAETADRLAEQCEAVSRELDDLRKQIAQTGVRRTEARDGAAEARRNIESLVTERAKLNSEVDETTESFNSLEERLGEIRKQLTDDRRKHEELTGLAADLRVRLGEVEVRVEDLISRTADELSIDLPAAYGEYTHDEQRDWEAVKTEISELRGKIDRLGNVNLDAIAEQDQLQKREKFLSEQTEDIQSSQRQLANLIKRINTESRKRFEESFRAVRAHFNELFRKLFGGGKADILLSDPENVLESGIDIVARPPGKELRSITLLSGGEKTMTALALLFSFFKARPGPFCLLDEVDAALDEQNTDRFVQLVREFLGTSQFVIITHAKRTIAMADQIYGLTMQQPGVSKPISVRFEDATKMVEQAEKDKKPRLSAQAEPVGA